MDNIQIAPLFGDLYFASLEMDGHVQGGIRPVLIAQNNTGNKYSETVTIMPLTGRMDKFRRQPTHVIIPADTDNGLRSDSVVLVEQTRVINKHQLGKRLGFLKTNDLRKVKEAVYIQFPFPT